MEEMNNSLPISNVTYYLKDNKGIKNITVVLLASKTGTETSRGVAVTSEKDMFNKKRGRQIAFGRAVKSMKQQETCTANEFRRPDVIDKVPFVFKSKCEYNPELTIYEKKLLKK